MMESIHYILLRSVREFAIAKIWLHITAAKETTQYAIVRTTMNHLVLHFSLPTITEFPGRKRSYILSKENKKRNKPRLLRAISEVARRFLLKKRQEQCDTHLPARVESARAAQLAPNVPACSTTLCVRRAHLMSQYCQYPPPNSNCVNSRSDIKDTRHWPAAARRGGRCYRQAEIVSCNHR